MESDSIARLKEKLAQAHSVIEHLMDKASFNGGEAHRALDYFSKEGFDGNFLPWPRHTDDRLRPDELNAANDD